MNIQAPPNLSPGVYPRLIGAGLNDWGGISPVTPDHVNPEAPWPAIDELARLSAEMGKLLVNRLAVYPAYARAPDTWLAPEVATQVRRMSDAEGFARDDDWAPGNTEPPPAPRVLAREVDPEIARIVDRATAGQRLDHPEIVRLFAARDADYRHVTGAANALRQAVSGDVVRYVVNRNINYTNICYFRCRFCAFSKGRTHEDLRGAPYDLALEEVSRRARRGLAARRHRGLPAGRHPSGLHRRDLRRDLPRHQGGGARHAHPRLLAARGDAGRRDAADAAVRLPGATEAGRPRHLAGHGGRDPRRRGARHHLPRQDQHRRNGSTCSAPRTGSACARPRPSCTATSRRRSHWSRHLLALRDLQVETGGFTEFVPLPFVHMEAPMYRQGRARRGPTFREAVIMHSVARLVLHPAITNIQTSWVKMGPGRRRDLPRCRAPTISAAP